MPSIYLPCPRCSTEIEVEMRYDSGDYSTGIFGGWEPDGFTQSCACVITPHEDELLGERAAKIANDNDLFGVSHIEPDYEPF